MMLVRFKKERAEYFLRCLNNGQPMTRDCPEPGWTIEEMMQLAGACFYAICCHGPEMKFAGMEPQDGVDEDELLKRCEPPADPEHREAWARSLLNDFHAAVEVVGKLTSLVHQGEYDKDYEASMMFRAGQIVDGQINTEVVPLEGFKQA